MRGAKRFVIIPAISVMQIIPKARTKNTSKTIYQDIRYNALGQEEMTTLPYSSNDVPIWNKIFYDIYGRVKRQITNMTESGSTTPQSLTTNYLNSRLTRKVTDAFGNVSKQTYNHFGELIESEDNGGRIGYTYYSSGLPKSVVYKTPGGAAQTDTEITMEYDDFGNQTKLHDPSAGTSSYTYNSLGQLLSQTDANHNTYTMQYDQAGRLISKTGPEGVYTYTYNSSGNGIHKLRSIEAPNGTAIRYAYDSYNRVVQTTERIDGEEFTYTYEYDNTNLRRMEYPSGFAVKYVYDAYSNHSATTDDDNNTIWAVKSLHTLGGIRSYILGNGLTTTHTYDADYGTLVGIHTGAVQQIELGFKNADNKLQQNLQSRTSFGMQETFAYDKANRLTRSQVEQHIPILVEYADNGNITYKSNVGTYSYENSSSKEALPYSVKGIQTPAHGVQALERLELSYTPHKKIAQIMQTKGNKMAEFTYGANEQRVKMVLKEHNKAYKTKYYVGAYEKEIMPNGSTRELHYIDGVGIYVQSSSGAHEMYYTHKDHLGSITEITDSQGAVVERLSYDAWGNRRNSHTWDYDSAGDNFLFDRGYTGHEHLDDFAIINMNGRIYDPLTGRMMAPDNYVQSSLSQNLNRYSYCLNNPLIYTDPSGDFITLAAAAWLFFTESGYEVQKYISPVAVKVDVHFSSEQKGIGINASVGVPKVLPISYRAHAGATYYWQHYDNSYKGWEKRYGGEWTFGGIVNYSGTTFISGETSQTLNSVTIGTPFFNFKYENDYMFNAGKYFIGVPSADGGDRYRTAAARLQLGFLKVGVNLFTGDPGLDAGIKETFFDSECNDRETYKENIHGNNPDKYRAGVLHVGIGPMRIGRNSEKIRNTFQNKFAHDFIMGGKSPYFKVDKTREPKWYFYFGTGTGNTLW